MFLIYNIFMENENFKNKKLNAEKLIKCGFKKQRDTFVYTKNILDDEFELKIIINDKEIKTFLTEISTGELYTLHLIEGVKGAFVGRVKQEYEAILKDIEDKCFETDVFKFPYSKKVIEYAYSKYGDNVEYLWEKFPENAVCRWKDNKKWYFAILTSARGKLGDSSIINNPDELTEVINLQINPEKMEEITKDENIYPAYHMNKKRWISIVLDGSVDIEKIYKFIDKSYELAGKKAK